MRTFKVLTIAMASTAVFAGCPEPVTTPPPAGVELSITSVTPSAVFDGGGTTVNVVTENGCAVAELEATVKDIAVTFVETSPNNYTFTTPPIAGPKTSHQLTITCKAKSYDGKAYKAGKNTASKSIEYDPALCPQPTLKSYAPVGDRISVLAKVVVEFSEKMDGNTMTKDNIQIQGVDGEVSYSASTNTATFTAKEQLKYDETYTVVVKGGGSGVISACGKQLKTTVRPGGGTPDPAQDSWTFKTRKEGEGNPWVGDISAAAGISTGGNYKLFSVTGQPTPVGEAYAGTPENHTYKLQSGFIYATQPPQQ